MNISNKQNKINDHKINNTNDDNNTIDDNNNRKTKIKDLQLIYSYTYFEFEIIFDSLRSSLFIFEVTILAMMYECMDVSMICSRFNSASCF